MTDTLTTERIVLMDTDGNISIETKENAERRSLNKFVPGFKDYEAAYGELHTTVTNTLKEYTKFKERPGLREGNRRN